ncbi:hypothetical protein PR048_026540 [Dryococelus australis]|uniref:Stalled ribosome sensor GCN1-like N-terminal domain-containing protein n=1 Tax=Dryococelus australis TaxID=614101 RepID=A0ABQ9GLN4_9NEOP|nr:hypothetical protein PR048_026540 [Dryococelus australis]
MSSGASEDPPTVRTDQKCWSFMGCQYYYWVCNPNQGQAVAPKQIPPPAPSAPSIYGTTLKVAAKEGIAISHYEEHPGNTVQKCGLVDIEYCILAATLDGIICNTGILEVKCPHSTTICPAGVAREAKTFFCTLSDGKWQLHVTGHSWCDLVVWTLKELQGMKTKHYQFYLSCLLLQLADHCCLRGQAIREPLYITEVQQRNKKKFLEILKNTLQKLLFVLFYLYFYTCGNELKPTVNCHNCVYWVDENLHIVVEQVVCLPGLTVWSGMSDGGLVGTFFFDGTLPYELNGTMLQEIIVPAVHQLYSDDCYFKWDSALLHYHLDVQCSIDMEMKQGNVEYPPRSPDLMLLYYLWGTMKNTVYATKPWSLDAMSGVIWAALNIECFRRIICFKGIYVAIGITETIVRGICKVLVLMLPRYRDSTSQSYVRNLIVELVKLHGDWTMKHLTATLSDIANAHKNLVHTKNTSQSGLYALGWSCLLIEHGLNNCSDNAKAEFQQLVEAQTWLLSVVVATQDRRICSKAYRLLSKTWRAVKGCEELYGNALSSAEPGSQVVVFGSYLLQYLTETKKADLINKYKPVLLDTFIKVVVSSKQKPAVYMIKESRVLLRHVTHDDFRQQLLPAMRKAMLRNPEVILEAVGHIFSCLSLDLSQYALDIFKNLAGEYFESIMQPGLLYTLVGWLEEAELVFWHGLSVAKGCCLFLRTEVLDSVGIGLGSGWYLEIMSACFILLQLPLRKEYGLRSKIENAEVEQVRDSGFVQALMRWSLHYQVLGLNWSLVQGWTSRQSTGYEIWWCTVSPLGVSADLPCLGLTRDRLAAVSVCC